MAGILMASLAATAPVASQPAGNSPFAAIRAAELKLATIGYRLATANAALCDRLEPGTGLLLHTPAQYSRDLRDDALRYFRFDGPVGVEGVIDGSPAAAAGIAADDTLFAIGSARFTPADPSIDATTTPLVEASRQIADQSASNAMTVYGRRDGADYARTLRPIRSCRTRFELLIDPEFVARADGVMVQISSSVLERYSEQMAAAVVAHELAHNILHHRERLEARGVSYGMLSGFGRNVRYFRQTELEADILSISLLANAGYDPQAAASFWRSFGPTRPSGALRSRTHPRWQDRVATIEHTIGTLGTARPDRPALLASRDRALDGNWEALIVKAR